MCGYDESTIDEFHLFSLEYTGDLDAYVYGQVNNVYGLTNIVLSSTIVVWFSRRDTMRVAWRFLREKNDLNMGCG